MSLIFLCCILRYKSKKSKRLERDRNTANDLNTHEPIYDDLNGGTTQRLTQNVAYAATIDSLEYESIRSIPPERGLPPGMARPPERGLPPDMARPPERGLPPDMARPPKTGRYCIGDVETQEMEPQSTHYSNIAYTLF